MPTLFRYVESDTPPAPYGFEGLGGERVTLSIVRLRIAIRGCRELVVDAAASEGEPNVFLGRDVMNCFRVVLDGPNLRMEID